MTYVRMYVSTYVRTRVKLYAPTHCLVGQKMELSAEASDVFTNLREFSNGHAVFFLSVFNYVVDTTTEILNMAKYSTTNSFSATRLKNLKLWEISFTNLYTDFLLNEQSVERFGQRLLIRRTFFRKSYE